MEARVITTLDAVPGDDWRRATPPDFFFRLGFLRALAASGVEDARYRYVLLVEGGEAVGAAVLSAFTLRLDLLAGDPWTRGLRRFVPRLLDVPMVCCGAPASFGQHHLHVVPGVDPREAFRLVDGCLESWAGEERRGLVLWKEWSPAHGLAPAARDHGYVVLPTLPDHVIEPLPRRVEDFVGAMRAAYRRKFRPALELVNGPGPVWRAGSIRLEERPFEPGAVTTFKRGYDRVMERTRVRLETYPREFFERLAGSDLDVRVLHLERDGDGVGLTALLVPADDTLTFALLAKERERYEDGLYSLLLRAIVLVAIRRGYRRLRLGQTSDYAKASVGARPRRLETFIRVRSAFRHGLFRRVGPLFFPERESPRLRVFRADAESDHDA